MWGEKKVCMNWCANIFYANPATFKKLLLEAGLVYKGIQLYLFFTLVSSDLY